MVSKTKNEEAALLLSIPDCLLGTPSTHFRYTIPTPAPGYSFQQLVFWCNFQKDENESLVTAGVCSAPKSPNLPSALLM